MIKPKDRVVLITGGSSGIGFELAKQKSEQGSKVIICGRSLKKLETAKAKCENLITFKCDISCKEDRELLTETILRSYPDLNMLINNAGVVYRYLLENAEDLTAQLTNEWEVNYFAPVSLTQTLLPLMVKNHGTIVNVCSALSFIPISIQPNYCATKAALMSMTQSMRVRYKKLGVSVVGIYYPEVDTPFQDGKVTSRAISPQVAASETLKQLNQGKLEIHIKFSKKIYALSRLMPQKATQIINKVACAKFEA